MGLLRAAVLFLCLTVLFAKAADPKPTAGEKKVVCYYTNWSYKRAAPFDFTPEKIDPFICTHIIYAFADIGFRNNLISSDPEFDFDRRAYANITGLKKKNKNLKVMIGIGGWIKGTIGFGRITANETNRKEFAKNAVRYIRGYMFDGLDLNWQHPTLREGGTPEDKENYVLLAQTLREEFEKEAILKNKPRLLLSIAISHNLKFLPHYDVANFNNYMDFISVICYDYHFSYESAVNHHSPLYSLEEDNDYSYDRDININYTINYFMELADADKLVLGIPAYGRTYRLENAEDTALGSFADGAGDAGPVTGEKGWFAYFEICNFIRNENWTVVQTKPGSAGPYAYKGDQWVCFDDIQMIRAKAAYAIEKGLAGVMFWTMDYDDFSGRCDNPIFPTFPIIRAARSALSPVGDMVFDDANDYEDEAPEQSRPTVAKPTQTPVPSLPVPRTPVLPPPVPRTPVPVPPVTLTNSRPAPPVHHVNSLGKRPPLAMTPLRTPVPGPRPFLVPKTATMEQEEGEVVESALSETNIVSALISLIEKAGGMKNFCKILRQAKQANKPSFYHNSYSEQEDTDNSIVFETPKLPPIMVILSNSSIFIKEVNIYQKP